jgi:hypothetical protein
MVGAFDAAADGLVVPVTRSVLVPDACPTVEVLVAFGVLASLVEQAAVARNALTAAAVRTVRPLTVLPGWSRDGLSHDGRSSR